MSTSANHQQNKKRRLLQDDDGILEVERHGNRNDNNNSRNQNNHNHNHNSRYKSMMRMIEILEKENASLKREKYEYDKLEDRNDKLLKRYVEMERDYNVDKVNLVLYKNLHSELLDRYEKSREETEELKWKYRELEGLQEELEIVQKKNRILRRDIEESESYQELQQEIFIYESRLMKLENQCKEYKQKFEESQQKCKGIAEKHVILQQKAIRLVNDNKVLKEKNQHGWRRRPSYGCVKEEY